MVKDVHRVAKTTGMREAATIDDSELVSLLKKNALETASSVGQRPLLACFPITTVD